MADYEELPEPFSCKAPIDPDLPEGCPGESQPYVHMSKAHRTATRNEFDPCCKPNEFRKGRKLTQEESDLLWLVRFQKFTKQATEMIRDMDEDFAAISDYCTKHQSKVEAHVLKHKKKANQMVAELMEVGSALRVELSRCMEANSQRNRKPKEMRTDVVITGCGAMEQILAMARLEFYPRLDAYISFLEEAVTGWDIRKHREHVRKMLADPTIKWYYKPFKWLSAKAEKWFMSFKAWLGRIRAEAILSWALVAIPAAMMLGPIYHTLCASSAVIQGGFYPSAVFKGMQSLCNLIDQPIFLIGLMVTLRAWVAAPPAHLRGFDGKKTIGVSVHYAKRILNFLGAGTAVEIAQTGWDMADQMGVPDAARKAADLGLMLGKQSVQNVKGWTGKAFDMFVLTLEGFFWLVFFAFMTTAGSWASWICGGAAMMGEYTAWFAGFFTYPVSMLEEFMGPGTIDPKVVQEFVEERRGGTGTEDFPDVSKVPVQEWGGASNDELGGKTVSAKIKRIARKFVTFVRKHAASATLKDMITAVFNMETQVVDFITHHAVELTPAFLGISGLGGIFSMMYMAQTPDDELLGNRKDLLRMHGKKPVSDVLRQYGRITPTPPLAYVYRRCRANGGSEKDCREEAEESQATLCDYLPEGSTMPGEYDSLCDRKALEEIRREREVEREAQRSTKRRKSAAKVKVEPESPEEEYFSPDPASPAANTRAQTRRKSAARKPAKKPAKKTKRKSAAKKTTRKKPVKKPVKKPAKKTRPRRSRRKT